MTTVVGRHAELARLDAALGRVAGGRAATVVLTGEPGIGKSALLGELAARAEAGNCLVLDGRATEFERDEPFAVFTAALGDYLAAQQATGAAPGGDAHLGAVFPVLGPAGAVPDRLRTHAAVRTLLAALAHEHPLVLVLDDLHWADAASVDLFGYLVRHLPRARVLLAGALRPAQAPPRLRQAVEHQPDLETLPLGPLGRDDVAALLTGTDGAQVTELYRESGGNPFYLHALTGAPREVGPVGADVPGVPDAVLSALTAELRALSGPDGTAAAGAAVAGDPFEAGLAAQAADLAAPAFLDALDELVASGLVRATGEPRRFRFRHPIVRHAV
ncbi:MAG: AAA family ATPase, partial [Pseudonocardia sp.]|nr:AAA family ATPase [Pseudonocardia sp.]